MILKMQYVMAFYGGDMVPQSILMELWEFKDKLFSNFSYETELEDLQRTVSSITAALHVAETKLELSDELQRQIEELKDTIFEADDLLDELVTLSHQQRVVDADGSLLDKVSKGIGPQWVKN
ncbi:hypothetical protein BVRB_3g055850 [Beta vulgaris subsp. vulgaris]|uniref:Disease resistance N-terminal domain-containing protein n=1 Tax=Beta vulgaris subsp. vulgaris TaxID=3555 RepID=A0A0J8CVA2_BETVV|nr:hypothetical protein BVRB_3g055850 [Beta vulgaris subsp. vulgaris]